MVKIILIGGCITDTNKSTNQLATFVYPGSETSSLSSLHYLAMNIPLENVTVESYKVAGEDMHVILNWYKTQMSARNWELQNESLEISTDSITFTRVLYKKENTGRGIWIWQQSNATYYVIVTGPWADLHREKQQLPDSDQVQGEEPLSRFPNSVLLGYESTSRNNTQIVLLIYGTNNESSDVVDWYKEQLQNSWTLSNESDSATRHILFFTRYGENISIQIVKSSEKKAYTQIEIYYAHHIIEPTEKFIIKNPVNLSQVEMISKFRSCAGHDFSGLNTDYVNESNRSMKHYFAPFESLKGTTKIQIFAPFDGIITEIDEDKGKPPYQKDLHVYIRGPSAGEWVFIFMHVSLNPDLKVGSTVKAGELIGYANVPMEHQDFDIALKKFDLPEKFEKIEMEVLERAMRGECSLEELYSEYEDIVGEEPPIPLEIYDSIFNHMSDEVLAEYAEKGVTPENIIICKEYRDAHPCDFNINYNREEDWVRLQH